MNLISSKLLNCTPHKVDIYDSKGEKIIASIPPSGYVTRLAQDSQESIAILQTEEYGEFPVVSPPKFGHVIGLPPCEQEPCPDIIVSMLVAKKLKKKGGWKGRVFIPDIGEYSVRKEGAIIGTRALVQYCA